VPPVLEVRMHGRGEEIVIHDPKAYDRQRFLEQVAAHLVVVGRTWTTPEDVARMTVQQLTEQAINNGLTLTVGIAR
jgi:hypothetical protein